MAELPAVPVPPVPPPSSPPGQPAPLSRTGQSTMVVLLVALAALIGYRWYGDHYGMRPSQLNRDVTHRIDLNKATKSELMQVPGIGPQLAERIILHRETHGRFTRVEDLHGVHGIGDATISKMRPWVTIDSVEAVERPPAEPERLTRKPAPATSTGRLIDINTASLAELDTLPGIGPVLAQRIIAEREKRPFTSVDDLRRVSGIGPKKLEAIREMVTAGDR